MSGKRSRPWGDLKVRHALEDDEWDEDEWGEDEWGEEELDLSGVWRRPRGEYLPGPHRLELCTMEEARYSHQKADLDWDDKGTFVTGIRGNSYHPEAYADEAHCAAKSGSNSSPNPTTRMIHTLWPSTSTVFEPDTSARTWRPTTNGWSVERMEPGRDALRQASSRPPPRRGWFFPPSKSPRRCSMHRTSNGGSGRFTMACLGNSKS